MYSTAQKGSSQRNGYGSVPFLCAFSDSKDAAELLRMISSHDCRAQNFIACLHVRPEIWRDSQSWRQPQWNPKSVSHGVVSGAPQWLGTSRRKVLQRSLTSTKPNRIQ